MIRHAAVWICLVLVMLAAVRFLDGKAFEAAERCA
jgi:hypothetical protein